MKKIVSAVAIAGILIGSSAFAEPKVRVDGAAPGEWTMDLDAAKKVAAEKNLPILLDFSGSDWCGWCKLMESNVFEKKEWTAYATNHIMQVLIDFPHDKTLVPEKYVKRNKKLQKDYNIAGFPTFIILEKDGKTEAGRLSAGQDKTPQSFIAEISRLFMYQPEYVEAYTKSLKQDQAKRYRELANQINKAKEDINAKKAKILHEREELAQLMQKLEDLSNSATEFRVAVKGEDQLKAYKKIKQELESATKELQDWLATSPEQNEANNNKYREMASKIRALNAQLKDF